MKTHGNTLGAGLLGGLGSSRLLPHELPAAGKATPASQPACQYWYVDKLAGSTAHYCLHRYSAASIASKAGAGTPI